jgi:hypothetical protein
MRAFVAGLLLLGLGSGAARGAEPAAADLTDWIASLGGELDYDGASRPVEIRLGFTWVADGDMDRIARISTLKRLDLSLTRVTDLGIERLKPLTGIEELNLYACEHITDTALAHLREWRRLRRLNLRGTDITDTGLAYVASHVKLEALDLSITQVTDNGMEHLAELTQLRELVLGGNKITALGLSILQLLPELKTLSLSGRQMRNSGFWDVAVTDLDIDEIAKLAQLEHLDVGGLKLTDLGVRKLASLQHLRSLDLSGTSVTGRGVAALSRLQHLEELSLSGAETIDDEAVPAITEMGGLAVLDLSETKISDAALSRLAGLGKLRRLHIDGTAVSQAGMDTLRGQRPDLRIQWSPQPSPAVH